MPYYLIEYLDEMLFFEFTEMLKNGRYVKRCKLCGRYFVLADKRKRDFCDRPYKGRRTCKQVGAKLFFEKGIEADAFLQQYLTEYNKVYSRRYRAAGLCGEQNLRCGNAGESEIGIKTEKKQVCKDLLHTCFYSKAS